MLFEPVVDAAGPGAVFETSSARFGHCLGRHVKDEHVKDVAKDLVQDLAEGVFGAAKDA